MRNRTYEKWKKQMLRSAKERKVPIVGHFELTPRCNLDCKMCFVHNQDSNALKNRELSTEKWKQIFDEAYDCGMMFASLTGGECLLREDFKELYLHLWKKRVFITVMTNGILLGSDMLAFFREYPPADVQISLYGSNEDGYLRVTGHRGFEKAVAAIQGLTEMNIPVHVAVTPSKAMGDDMINIHRYCKENKIWCEPSNFYLAKKRDNPSENDQSLSIDEIIRLSIEQAKVHRELTPFEGALPPCGGSCTEAPKGTTCTAGNAIAVVSWDGIMHPCTLLLVGTASVKEMSYAEAWEKTKQAAQEILRGMECVDCAYHEACPKCIAMRVADFYTGHCNPDVCEVTRKLVELGVSKMHGKTEDLHTGI